MTLYMKRGYIYIKCQYEEKNKLRKYIKGTQFDRVERAWKVPTTISTYRNLYKLDKRLLDTDTLSPAIRNWVNRVKVTASRLRELQEGKGDTPKLPEDFILPVTLYRHQLDSVAFAINLPKSALWLDLGLGKTCTAITIARLRSYRKEVSMVLVVAPLSLLPQWKDEIYKFSPTGEAHVEIADSTPTKRRLAYNALVDSPSKLKYLLTTYESVSQFQDVADTFDMFILDEATKIKNPSARRTKDTLAICKEIPYGVELTGLPYLNNPSDLFPQMLALDSTVYGDNSWDFNSTYIQYRQMPFGRMMVGYKNIEDLKNRAYYVAISKKKEDCLDLPAKLYLPNISVPIYDEQRALYDQIANEKGAFELSFKEGSVEFSSAVIAKMEKLQQILSGFLYTDKGNGTKGITFIDSPKYNALVELVSTSSDSFIVWARHSFVIAKIVEVLRSAGIKAAYLNNTMSPAEKQEAKSGFIDLRYKVIVCQLQSESQGHNLTAKNSTTTVYFENTFSVDQRWQSESRAHRIGMGGTASFVDLVIPSTIDEGIKEVLGSNLSVAEYVSKFGADLLLQGKTKSGLIVKKKVKLSRREEEEAKYNVDFSELKGIEGFDDISLD